MVEAHAERVVFEDDRRADLVFGESVCAENSGVIERLQKLELTKGGAFVGLAIFRAHAERTRYRRTRRFDSVT